MTVINTLSTLSISAFSKFSRKAIYIGEKGKKPKIDNSKPQLITALVNVQQNFLPPGLASSGRTRLPVASVAAGGRTLNMEE